MNLYLISLLQVCRYRGPIESLYAVETACINMQHTMGHLDWLLAAPCTFLMLTDH